jgi:N,N-dimethylformamidase beta subunit-like protein
MLNHSLIPVRGARRRPAIAAVAIAVLGAALTGSTPTFAPSFQTTGTVARVKPSKRPSIEVAFPRDSYRPGTAARLVVFSKRVSGVRMQIFRAGTETRRIGPRDEMRGTAVTPLRRLGNLRRNQTVWVQIPAEPTGFYYVKLIAGSRVGYAPFVLRPNRLAEHRIAVVMPTFTWQAYNFHDDDEDGESDTWYAAPGRIKTARLGRPYENRGVPPHYKYYDQPFLQWLDQEKRAVDYLGQTDVARSTGRRLAEAYDLIIFPGHHEYVTKREYDAVEGFRNRGGNLMFLSANNFFWKVVTRGNVMYRVHMWRDIGRPESALIGVQYIGNDMGQHRSPWIVRAAGEASWIFADTDLSTGSRLSSAGIEIDKTTRHSPPGTKVLAELPNLLGPGMTGQMAYYERNGAKVFAAGAFSLAGSVRQPTVDKIMDNLWERLSRP